MLTTRRSFLGAVAASGLATSAIAGETGSVAQVGDYETQARQSRYLFVAGLIPGASLDPRQQFEMLLDQAKAFGQTLVENQRHSVQVFHKSVALLGVYDRHTGASDFVSMNLTPCQFGTELKLRQSTPTCNLTASLLNNQVQVLASSSLQNDQSAFAFCMKKRA